MDYETLSTIYELLNNAYIVAKKDETKANKQILQYHLSHHSEEENPYIAERDEAVERREKYAHAYFEFCDVMWGTNGRKKEI